MKKIFYISDPHYYHKNIIDFDERNFFTVTEMNNTLIQNWNSVVNNEDEVYILGDVSWGNLQETKEILIQLKGIKYLIKGNHDQIFPETNKKNEIFQWVKNYAEINDNGRKVVLSHYPIIMYNHQFRNGYMIYGHVHGTLSEIVTRDQIRLAQDNGIPCKIYNAWGGYYNYTPVTLDQMIEVYEKMGYY